MTSQKNENDMFIKSLKKNVILLQKKGDWIRIVELREKVIDDLNLICERNKIFTNLFYMNEGKHFKV